ncbi:unnamed protein product [Closterium sp. Naga37s-1]|nr:unnamed protein product [Closterium sp. Naga37s-1]
MPQSFPRSSLRRSSVKAARSSSSSSSRGKLSVRWALAEGEEGSEGVGRRRSSVARVEEGDGEGMGEGEGLIGGEEGGEREGEGGVEGEGEGLGGRRRNGKLFRMLSADSCVGGENGGRSGAYGGRGMDEGSRDWGRAGRSIGGRGGWGGSMGWWRGWGRDAAEGGGVSDWEEAGPGGRGGGGRGGRGAAGEGGGVGRNMGGIVAEGVALLDDEEVERMDDEVIQALFERVVEAQTQLHNHRNLLAFSLVTCLAPCLLFSLFRRPPCLHTTLFERVVEAQSCLQVPSGALYDALLSDAFRCCQVVPSVAFRWCFQAQSFQSYQVASAHSILLPPVGLWLRCHPLSPTLTSSHALSSQPSPPGSDYSGDSSYSFASSSDFYTWLNNSIIQVIWSDPQCGDGTCTPPTEFPAVGRFGCAQDCGNARNVTTVTVALRCHFTSREAMLSSSWNLCSTAIRDVCWFQDPQQFTELTGWYTVTLRLPDNDWFVSLTAPSGGVGVYVYESLGKKTSASEPGSSSGLNGSGSAADGSSQSPPPSPPPPVSTAPAPTPFQPTSSSSSHSSAFPSPPPASATAPSSSASSAPSLSTKEYLRPSNGTGANVLLASVDGCVEDGESGLQRCRQQSALCSPFSSLPSPHSPLRFPSLLPCPRPACNAMLPGTAFDPPDNITCSQAFTLFEASLQTPSCSDMLSESPAAATPQPPTAAAAPTAPAVSAAVETPKATSSLSARLLLEPSAPDEHPMSSLHPSWPAESLLNSWTGMASVHLHHQQLRQKPREERTDASTLHAPHKSSLTASAVRSSRQLFPSPPTSSFIPATSSQLITEAQRLVWESLGTMDSERIRACQVAVARALPSRRFSAAQQALFVHILVMALQSVVQKMPSDAVQAATHLLHIFNDAVVSPDASPCPQGASLFLSADYMVLWDSASFTRRVISDGQRVTWVWNDDDYHELSAGSVGSEPFLGFGAGRLGLSRLATCAWDKIGPRDASDEPAPCVLRSPDDTSPPQFAYTKVFGTARDMAVRDSPQSLTFTLIRARNETGACMGACGMALNVHGCMSAQMGGWLFGTARDMAVSGSPQSLAFTLIRARNESARDTAAREGLSPVTRIHSHLIRARNDSAPHLNTKHLITQLRADIILHKEEGGKKEIQINQLEKQVESLEREKSSMKSELEAKTEAFAQLQKAFDALKNTAATSAAANVGESESVPQTATEEATPDPQQA